MKIEKMSMPTTEPYRLLFPLGCLMGTLGVAFWLLFQFGWIQFYPRTLHGNLMFFGLLWSFVAGFLMTAIPKMTATAAAHWTEISAALALVFLQFILNVQNRTDLSVIIFSIQNIFLVYFILKRFLVHRKVPFFGFIFIPAAFIQSFVGVVLFFASFDRSLILLFCGEAFILNLILGLGSRLIPVISRLPNSLMPNESKKQDSWFVPMLVLILINTGYWIELAGFKDVGLGFRIFGILIAATKLLRFFTKPTTWSYVGVGLKFGILMLVIGQILNLSFFGYALAGLHFIYIGGFTLITFLIATRVMLAHGNQSLAYEVAAPRILVIVTLFLISAILRYTVANNVTSSLLSLSAVLFIISIGLWSTQFIKILKSIHFKHDSSHT